MHLKYVPVDRGQAIKAVEVASGRQVTFPLCKYADRAHEKVPSRETVPAKIYARRGGRRV